MTLREQYDRPLRAPPKALSPTQRDALEYAQYLAKLPRSTRWGSGGDSDGWFYAQFTTRGSIEFFCRPQTLESLFRLGLLERRIIEYPDGYGRKEYRFKETPCPSTP